MEIDDPGEFYRGSRFDWTAGISQVILDGKHTFCTYEKKSSYPINYAGRGFYNEFGIDGALAYGECKIGDWFHKIGIGKLKKENNEPYSFSSLYKIQPLQFKTEKEQSIVRCIAQSEEINGYAYRLDKSVSLEGPTFSIEYELKNTGSRAFQTSEYVHNFISLNNKLIGPAYRLKFSFNPNPSNFKETVNPGNKVDFTGGIVAWTSDVENDFFFSHLTDEEFKECYWEMTHEEENIGLKELCRGGVSGVNLWGSRHVVSPELFHPVKLLPGESDNWKRIFEFRVL